MLSRDIYIIFLLVIVCMISIPNVYSQEKAIDIEELKKKAPRVFIDCNRCDIDFIRTEITFVNYVWDRREADVHVLVTTQRTGSGGREYSIAFIGQKGYADLQNTLKYFSNRTDTDDDIRRGLVQVLKLGLAPYVASSPMSEVVSVRMEKQAKSISVEDKWNFWIFNISLRTRLSGESTRESI